MNTHKIHFYSTTWNSFELVFFSNCLNMSKCNCKKCKPKYILLNYGKDRFINPTHVCVIWGGGGFYCVSYICCSFYGNKLEAILIQT